MPNGWSSVVTRAGVILSTVPIGKIMGLALIPRDDQSEYEVHVITPEGYSPGAHRQGHERARRRGSGSCPGTQHMFTTIGQYEADGSSRDKETSPRATIYVRMKDLEDRDYTQFAIQQQARKILADYPDLRASVNDVSPFQGGGRPRLSRSTAGPDLDGLAKYSDQLIEPS